jgi:hypothetical protein
MRHWIAVITLLITLLLSASQTLAASDKATLADWQARMPVLIVIIIVVLLIDLAFIAFVTIRASHNQRGGYVEVKGE